MVLTDSTRDVVTEDAWGNRTEEIVTEDEDIFGRTHVRDEVITEERRGMFGGGVVRDQVYETEYDSYGQPSMRGQATMGSTAV